VILTVARLIRLSGSRTAMKGSMTFGPWPGVYLRFLVPDPSRGGSLTGLMWMWKLAVRDHEVGLRARDAGVCDECERECDRRDEPDASHVPSGEPMLGRP
jgi:hypothetical protein